jgi:excisionase family DNA binding protein
MSEERWLTVAQVADQLQVDEETVRRWIRRGELEATNIGTGRPDYRIRPTVLQAFLERRTGKTGKAAG